MANVAIFDISTDAVKQYLRSVNTPNYSSRPDVIVNPDITAFQSVPLKYWKHDAGTIREMTQAEKDAVDAAEVAATQAVEDARLLAIDDSIEDALPGDATLAKVDARIDAIASFADLKVLLKKMVRHIAKKNDN